jgi:hypothetical protein
MRFRGKKVPDTFNSSRATRVRFGRGSKGSGWVKPLFNLGVHISGVSIRYERGIDMKRYIALFMLLVVTCISLGKNRPVKDPERKPAPAWVQEARLAAGSDYVETFAEAFTDPNILIGVFENPLKFSPTTLSSREVLEYLPGFYKAMRQFNLRRLRSVKPIKGKFPEPVCFTRMGLPPMVEGRPSIPPVVTPKGSKWVLALKKTSNKERISRYGHKDDIEKYKFINDHTMFTVSRYGHGALCLKWPEPKKESRQFPKPRFVVQVPESIVGDFEAILRVMPHIRKEKIDPNGVAAIDKTSKILKTDAAKSIFAEVLGDKLQKAQDPNEQ